MNNYNLNQSQMIHALLTLDASLKEDNDSSLDDYLGIQLTDYDESSRYECTPQESIVFASTGVDGDHFAFITSPGIEINLDEAPIVFVQPMNTTHHVKIVASNIRDLLSLFVSLKELYVLEGFDWYRSEEEFMNDYYENYVPDLMIKEEEVAFISAKLKELFELQEINNVYHYITELRNAGFYPRV